MRRRINLWNHVLELGLMGTPHVAISPLEGTGPGIPRSTRLTIGTSRMMHSRPCKALSPPDDGLRRNSGERAYRVEWPDYTGANNLMEWILRRSRGSPEKREYGPGGVQEESGV